MFGTKKTKIEVTGMSCGHCEKTVEDGVNSVDGVRKVKADHAKNVVTISYRGDCPSIDEVKAKVEDLGFEAANSWV
jgi:copper chaperone CopZ